MTVKDLSLKYGIFP